MEFGIAGRFCGLEDEFANEGTSKVVLLPVPFDGTSSYRKGSDKGPESLIEASRFLEMYDIETAFEVHTVGIHTAQKVLCEGSQEMVAETYRRVKEYLQQDKFVVTLGGEHSISQAPIRAHAEKYPGMSVLQLDAHTDLDPALEGDPYSHGSVMSRVREISDISSIVAVGLRSMASKELPYVDMDKSFFAHQLFDDDAWMDKAIDALSENVYITFDLDAFDPSILPGTGTPEPGGMQWYQVLKFLRKVICKRKVVGFDIVELCPLPPDTSSDFLAAKLLQKMLSYIYKS